MERDGLIFIACVGKKYARCEKRLNTSKEFKCPPLIVEFCFNENSARLSQSPHDKFLYLGNKEFFGKGMSSVMVPELGKYAVFLEVK